MMNFRQNKNKGTRKVLILIVLSALFLILLLSGSLNRIFSASVSAIGRPFLRVGNSTSDWFDKNFSFLKNKTTLKEENRSLKERVQELESKILSCQALEEQNKELKNVLSRNEEQKYLIAFVLSRPPQSPYDVLIIDAGSENGIENGMEVTAYGDILIGHVNEVFTNTSKVKLISFPQEENSAMMLDSNVPVIVVGQGSGNFEINLSKAVEIKEGEKVVTLGINPLLLGIVEKIKSNPSDPFQKILFRLPVNIQELNYVMIKI